MAKHERNYLKKFFPQTNPKLLFVPTKVEANLFEVDKDREETGGEDQQSLTMKKNLDKVSKCLKKKFGCKCLILPLPSLLEGRLKSTEMSCSLELFFFPGSVLCLLFASRAFLKPASL